MRWAHQYFVNKKSIPAVDISCSCVLGNSKVSYIDEMAAQPGSKHACTCCKPVLASSTMRLFAMKNMHMCAAFMIGSSELAMKASARSYVARTASSASGPARARRFRRISGPFPPGVAHRLLSTLLLQQRQSDPGLTYGVKSAMFQAPFLLEWPTDCSLVLLPRQSRGPGWTCGV